MTQNRLIISPPQDTGTEQFKPVRKPIDEREVANSADSEALGKDLYAIYRIIVRMLGA